MRFQTSQQMKLGQQMKLAPRMIQSMEILQLPTLALEERIEQELESNITLETVEPGGDEASVEAEREQDARDDSSGERELSIDETGSSDFERLDSMERSYGEAFENEYSAASARRIDELDSGGTPNRRLDGERDAKMDAMANAPARGQSFSETLLEQWSFAEVDDRVRALGILLIGYIEDDGLLGTPLETIADRASETLKPVATEELERAVIALQDALEPTGLAARDIRECLLLQIDSTPNLGDAEPHRALVRRLVSDHLEDLAHNRMPKIVEGTGEAVERVKQAVQALGRFSISPGRALHDESPPIIVPDAIIEYDDDEDRYIPRLADQRLPSLRVSPRYARMARDRATDKKTREFLKTNLTNAQWLIDAVSQRRHTLLRVLRVVTDAQRDFFDQGPQALRPLPMTQVADQLGVHVATVSRAVAGKHVVTPRGVMLLRRFFSGGTQTESGQELSWEAVRAALQEVVDGEDKSSPLSDEAIAERLTERGIEIARRTVAKYRSQLGIPSARLRRRY